MLSFTNHNIAKYSWLLKYWNVRDETGIFIAKKSKITIGLTIGDGTRINGKIVVKGLGKVNIGKYCAFGEEIRIISSNHNSKDIVLQYALQKRIGMQIKPLSHDIIIGHGVWIGDSVLILPGVEVGNGAILAGGSVITKNVLPYEIVGGNPAKHIRFRFDEDKINKIEDSKWWNWSIDKMRENINFFRE